MWKFYAHDLEFPIMQLYLALLLALLNTAVSRPQWSWDVVPNYFHCANVSGEWNPDALQKMASKPFVVFEKNHKLFEVPVGNQAEEKITESCRK